MEISDEGQLRALYLLLSKLKYSDIDTDDLFHLVPKSKINEVHELIRNYFYNKILESNGEAYANHWLIDTSFKFESDCTQNIIAKIDKWDKVKCSYYKSFDNTQLEELARSLIKPFDNNSEDVAKLVDYIKNKINNTCT
jgi:hypothetical protein